MGAGASEGTAGRDGVACTACGHANRAGARFCEGCGAALARRCPACATETRPGARFCDACGTALGGAPAAPPPAPVAETRKLVSVLFVDLVGSTALQERLDPETARRVVERFAAAMREVVAGHRGTVVKSTGDGLMAVWGVPVLDEDDAVRAVRAGLAMHERLAALNDVLARERGVHLRMRAGVNSGEVVVGPDGDVFGDPVNVAARLEAAAPAGGVLVGSLTHRLVRDAVELEPVAPLDLKGKAEKVPAWRVLAAASSGRAARAAEAPFVGRAAELGRLRTAWDAAVASRACRLVTVVGSPGLGKSRLASAFAKDLGDAARVVLGRCEPTGEGLTLLPLAEALRGLAGIDEEDAPATARDRLAALLGEDDGDRDRVVERAAAVLGLAPPGAPEETFWAVRRLLEAAARTRPLLVVVDDVHWGQPQFLDLLEHLVGWMRDAPVLLLALARPELRDVRPALAAPGRHVQDVLDLEPLDAESGRDLAAALLGDAEIPVGLARRVLEATEGNPLFLSETVRMLVDDGVLERRGNSWVATEDVEVPPTIQALLAARLERLATEQRCVLERAAVVGKQFARGAVAALAPPDVGAEVDAHLEGLRRRDLVEPEGTYWIDEPLFRFHHVLIRDAAYRALLKEARADLHERFADWLAAKAGDRVGEHEEVLAFHLEQAHELRRQLGPLDEHGDALGVRAAGLLAAAGRRALAREDLAAAANLLRRALDRGREDPEVLLDLVEALVSAGEVAAAEAAVARLEAVAGGDARLEARARLARGDLGRLTGALGLREAAERLEAVADELSAAGDDAGRAKALELRARSIAPLGRVAEAERVLDAALAAARRAEDDRRTTAVLSVAPLMALWGPSPVPRASGRCLDVIRILRIGGGHRVVEARALRCQAVLEAMRGRGDAARRILDGVRATFEELGLRLDLLELATAAGLVELLLDRPEAAEPHLRQAATGLKELGAPAGVPLGLLARALAGTGREEEALVVSRRAEAAAGDDLQAGAVWRRARAPLLARHGELDEAERLAREAVAIAEPTDALADHAEARLVLAAVLLDRGDEADARTEAARAANLFAEKGHTTGEARARAVLGGGEAADATRFDQPVLAVPRGSLALQVAQAGATDIADGRVGDMVRHLAPGFRWSDRRRLSGLAAGEDAAAMIALWQSVLEASEDVRIAPLAPAVPPRPGRILCHWRPSGSAEGIAYSFEILAGYVLDREGRLAHLLTFDADDLGSAATALEEAFAEAHPEPDAEAWFDGLDDAAAVFSGDALISPSARWAGMTLAASRSGRFDLLRYTPDSRFVDHRDAGFGDVPGPMHRDVLRSMREVAPDARFEYRRRIHEDDRIVVGVCGYRGTDVNGNPVDTAFTGAISAVEDGLTRIETWAPGTSPWELGAGDPLALRMLRGCAAAVDRRDLDGLVALLDADVRWEDRRDVVGGTTTGDLGRILAFWGPVVDGSAAGTRNEVSPAAPGTHRSAVATWTLTGAGDGAAGQFEARLLTAAVLGPDGRIARVITGDEDDREGVLERVRAAEEAFPADESWLAGLADGFRTFTDDQLAFPSARAAADLLAGIRTGRFERLRWAPGARVHDRRLVGSGDLLPERYVELARSMTNVAPGMRFEYREPVHVDPAVAVGRMGHRGRGPEGAPAETEVIAAVTTGSDGIERLEFWDPGTSPWETRATEGDGGEGGATVPPLAMRKLLAAGAALGRGDLERFAAGAHPDLIFVDQRAFVGPLTEGGRDELLDFWRRMWTSHRGTLRVEFTPLATVGHRAALARVVTSGTAGRQGTEHRTETVIGHVLAEDGRAIRTVGGDADQADAALADLEAACRALDPDGTADAWFADLADTYAIAGDEHLLSPALRAAAVARAAVNLRRWDVLEALYAPDSTFTDHRPFGIGPRAGGSDAAIRAMVEQAPGLRWAFHELLHLDDREIAGRMGWEGEGAHGGHVAVEWVAAVRVGPDGIEDVEVWPAGASPWDEGDGPVGDPASASAAAAVGFAWVDAADRRAWDEVLGLYTEDVVIEDVRHPGWTLVPDDQVGLMRELTDRVPDARLVVREVLHADEHVAAVHIEWQGTLPDGGRFELGSIGTGLVRDGRIARFLVVAPEDREGARAAVARLRGMAERAPAP